MTVIKNESRKKQTSRTVVQQKADKINNNT